MTTKKVTTKVTVKAKVKSKGRGRPTKYREEFAEQALRLCALGAKDKDLAAFFHVNETTINDWKYDWPIFSKSLKEGKDRFDTEAIEGALKHRALGYSHPETKLHVVDGCVVSTEVRKQYPPDTAALTLWLKNRNPDRWKDKQEIDLSNEDGSLKPSVIELVAPVVENQSEGEG